MDVAKTVLRIHVARYLINFYSTHHSWQSEARASGVEGRGAHVQDAYLYTASTSHSDRHKTTRYGSGSSRDDVKRSRLVVERMKTWPLDYLHL